jgi:hypothetical protein
MIYPYGPNIGQLDSMGRTIEAYYRVYNLDESDYTVPFYHISQATTDDATVQPIYAGAYAASFIEGHEEHLLPYIVDPTNVFGYDTTLTYAKDFFNNDEDLKSFMNRPQGYTARTPCAFTGSHLNIPPGGKVSIISVYGNADNTQQLNKIMETIKQPNYISNKRIEAEMLAKSITDNVALSTNMKLFDLYVQQDYLDNVLRGGLPIQLGKTYIYL